jgi:hypothetical protein
VREKYGNALDFLFENFLDNLRWFWLSNFVNL